MGIRHILTFTREPIECDMAEAFCPVTKPCNICNEYFNQLPLMERIFIEIPRRMGLFVAYDMAAFWNGTATTEQVKKRKKKLQKANRIRK